MEVLAVAPAEPLPLQQSVYTTIGREHGIMIVSLEMAAAASMAGTSQRWPGHTWTQAGQGVGPAGPAGRHTLPTSIVQSLCNGCMVPHKHPEGVFQHTQPEGLGLGEPCLNPCCWSCW
jgi:hypothetical protein